MSKLVFKILLFIAFISLNNYAFSQVGIGTVIPDPSSVLDISSTEKGMLAPRMTSAQRVTIVSPAEGLLVFDIDEDLFYFYDSSAWVPLESAEKRNNYKLVKNITDLADELIAGGGSKYQLDENYMYEINGTILFDFPIDLNDAYLRGHDTGEDIILNNSGAALFSGVKGGRVKDLLINGNAQQLFDITGSGSENVIFYSVVVMGASSIGTLSNLNTVYFEVFQSLSSANGLNVSDINSFYLDKGFWPDSNGGTYLTLSGTFANVQIAK